MASKSTHLKKSLADSSDLPPAMVMLVQAGYACALSVDGAHLADGLFACSTLLRDSHSQRSAETAKGRRAQAPPVEEALAAQEPREANALAAAAQTELTVLTKTVTGELGG